MTSSESLRLGPPEIAVPTLPGGVVLAGYYPPPLGGESVHIAELARRLRERGVGVEIVNVRRGAAPSAEYRSVSGALTLLGALRQSLRHGALLHLHTNGHSRRSWALVLAGAAALVAARARGVLTLHSGFCPRYLEEREVFERWIVRLVLAPFRHIVCVNERIRASLAALGVRDERMSVMPAFLGVEEPGPLASSDAALIARFDPCLVVAGATAPEYGLDALIESVGMLAARYPALGCVIMGAGDVRPLRAAVDRRGLTERVLCLGEVPHHRYLAFLAHADVFIRPSIVDGDAISVREALALGRPVVASDTDFRPDGVVTFRSGDAADLASKVALALDEKTSSRGAVPRESHSFERLLGIYSAAVRARRERP